jgi:hypothetical protein
MKPLLKTRLEMALQLIWTISIYPYRTRSRSPGSALLRPLAFGGGSGEFRNYLYLPISGLPVPLQLADP